VEVFVSRTGLRFLVAIALIALVIAPQTASSQARPGDSASSPLVIAYNGGAVTLDPIMRAENTSYAWQRHIFDTITIQDAKNGTPQPRIATSWKIVGQNRWRIELRKGVKFQNGRAMTSQDVADSIMDAASNPKAQIRNFLVTVAKVDPDGPNSVIITTKTPNPQIPLDLSQIPVMPEVEIKRDGRAFLDTHPVGTGAYEFVSWLAQDHLDLHTWNGYWGPKPAFDYVKLENISSGATRLAALLSGQVQVAEKIDPQDFARVKRTGGAYITAVGGVRIIYLSMDYWRKTGTPGVPGGVNPFMDPRVRRAVYQAIDVNALRDKVFNGAAVPATQWVAPAIESFDSSIKRLPYDPAGAKKLLAEAGYPNGFTVRLDATTDRYLDDSIVAQALAGMLSQAGINVQVNAVTKTIFFPNMDKGDFTLYLAGWGTTDAISAWETVFHCKDSAAGYGFTNREHYCNPSADQTMARAASIFDPHFRIGAERQAYAVAERKDFAYIPLYWEDVIAGVNNHIAWESRPSDELILAWMMTRK
jgi:peptide/nickel transport system substrate-binding protein